LREALEAAGAAAEGKRTGNLAERLKPRIGSEQRFRRPRDVAFRFDRLQLRQDQLSGMSASPFRA
jgi:hypothetical protein